MSEKDYELAIAYSRMGKAADKALRAKTMRTMRKYANELFERAINSEPMVKELEEIDDNPFEIASIIIQAITTDDREFYDIPPESISPDDPYSVYLRGLAVNAPRVLGYLARKQQQLVLSSSV